MASESEMLLLGGPFDAAEGPCYYAGRNQVWVRTEDSFQNGGRNGLLISDRKAHPSHVRYSLTSRAGEKFIYSYGEGGFGLVIEEPEKVLEPA